jgi:phosphoglucosamine mutase
MTMWPQTLINVAVQPGYDWQKSTALMAEKERAEAELVGAGRVLIRASGTEPLIRVMVEARDAQLAHSVATRLAAVIEPA